MLIDWISIIMCNETSTLLDSTLLCDPHYSLLIQEAIQQTQGATKGSHKACQPLMPLDRELLSGASVIYGESYYTSSTQHCFNASDTGFMTFLANHFYSFMGFMTFLANHFYCFMGSMTFLAKHFYCFMGFMTFLAKYFYCFMGSMTFLANHFYCFMGSMTLLDNYFYCFMGSMTFLANHF